MPGQRLTAWLYAVALTSWPCLSGTNKVGWGGWIRTNVWRDQTRCRLKQINNILTSSEIRSPPPPPSGPHRCL
jgi:hypothetical protein